MTPSRDLIATPRGPMLVRQHGAGPPIVLLHGAFQTGQCWRRVASLLEGSCRLVIPDLSRIGESAGIVGPLGMEEVAGDVLAALDAIGVTEFALVGHDLGGGVAAAMAQTRPEAIRALGFLDMLIPGFGFEEIWVPQPEGRFLWFGALNAVPGVIETLLPGREDAYVRLVHRSTTPRPEAIEEADLAAYCVAYVGAERLAALGGYFRAMWGNAERFRAAVAAGRLYRGPALALGGEYSTGTMAADSLRAIAPGAEGGVVPGAGHWLPEEAPDLVAARIRDLVG